MQLKKMLLYLFVTGVVASCTNEELLPEKDGNANSVENVVFTIEDWKTETGTRTIIQYGGYSLWNNRYFNEICVVPNVDDSNGMVAVQFPLSSLTTPGPVSQSASTLSTDANSGWNMKNGVEYIAYYPSYGGRVDKVSFELDVPKEYQSGTYNFDMPCDMMYAKATANSSTISFNFQRKYSLLGLRLTNVPSKNWKSLTLSNSNGDKVFNRAGTLNVLSGVVTPNKNDYFSNYVILNPTVKDGSIFLLFPTLPTTTGELSCVLVDDIGNRYVTTFPSKNVKEGYFYELYKNGLTLDNLENGHEFVNLGLPSGLLWATMNVGATEITNTGDYFAWGETEPHADGIYNLECYKWWNGDYLSNGVEWMTKYASYVDNKTTLDLEDDAARVNWGGRWRTPTENEMQELIDNCYWVWKDNYNSTGVNGWMVFMAKSAKYKGKYTIGELTRPYSISDIHIFVPAVKHRYTGMTGYSNYCHYWLSTVYEDNNAMARTMVMWTGSRNINADGREYACPIRAVFKRDK